MSRWLGLGGYWIDVGLPHFTALDRKPENSLKIKTVRCVRNGVMLNIDLNLGSNSPQQNSDTGNAHGMAALLRFEQPWFWLERVICADSLFASLNMAKLILEKGIRFTGAIRNATCEYPTRRLSQYTLSN